MIQKDDIKTRTKYSKNRQEGKLVAYLPLTIIKKIPPGWQTNETIGSMEVKNIVDVLYQEITSHDKILELIHYILSIARIDSVQFGYISERKDEIIELFPGLEHFWK